MNQIPCLKICGLFPSHSFIGRGYQRPTENHRNLENRKPNPESNNAKPKKELAGLNENKSADGIRNELLRLRDEIELLKKMKIRETKK